MEPLPGSLIVLANVLHETEEARTYVEQEGLSEALQTVIALATRGADRQDVGISLMRYDDPQGATLVKVTLHCGLRGRAAVAKEDEIFDRMWKAMEPETLNRFLVVVK